MKRSSGDGENLENRNWLETADDEFEQAFFEGEEERPAGQPGEGEEPEIDAGQQPDAEEAAGEGEQDNAREQEHTQKLKNPPKDKKKILIGLTAICLVALLAFFFSDRFYNMIRGRSSYTLQQTDIEVTFAEGSTQVLLDESGDTLVRCSQDGVQALNENGEVLWDIPFTMSSPYILRARDYMAVADRLGTGVLLIQNGAVITELTMENQILLHCVNEAGNTAIVIDDGDSHSVNLYSPSGELLMQRHTYADTDGIPVAVALNEDGSRMATAYIYYTGSTLQSIVTIFDLTENGSTLVDRIVGSISFENSVVSDLKFSGDECFFAASDRVGTLSAGSACEVLWQQQLSYQMESLVLQDSYFAVRYGEGLAGTVAPVTNNIVIYDYSGEVLYETSVEDATYLDAWGDTVIYGSGRLFYGISEKGSPKWQMDSGEDYIRLVAFSSGDTVAALRNGQIDYYDVAVNSVEVTDG